MYRRLDIQKRLTLTLWGVVVVALLVFGGALVVFHRSSLETRVREMMRPWVEVIAVGADAAVAFEDPLRAQEILDTLRAHPGVLEAELVLADGRSLARIQRDLAAPRLAHPNTGLHLVDDRAAWVEVLPGGARLTLVMSLAPLRQESTRLAWFFGVFLLALLVVTVSQQKVLERALVAPIRRLIASMELVRGRGEYSVRVPAVGSDEVARLSDSFNAMLAAVELRERELRELGALHRVVLDHLASGVVSVDLAGCVTSMNPAAEHITGHRGAEVVGRQGPLAWHDVAELTACANELQVAPDFSVFAALAGTPPREWTIVTPGGERVVAELAVSSLNVEGRRTGFVGLLTDLTRRKEVERQLLELNQQLERRVSARTAALEHTNRELEAFTYSVSHDLRAPLRHIAGFLELFEKRVGDGLDPQARHYIGRVVSASTRMSQLIDDLLSFSRMGRRELSTALVDLTAMARQVIASLEPEVGDRHVEWKVDALPPVRGDPAMLRTVLENLLGNALKFTRPRDPAVIELCGTRQGDEVLISVKDNGVGFDMRYADKLFGVFQRLHTAEQFEGTGIGLANVRRVIARHGGKTWAESAEGLGTTISFTLPLEGHHEAPTDSPR